MDWKAELVRKLNDLKPKDFDDAGKADVIVPFSVPWNYQFVFMEATLCVNSRPISWVGPGYLMLVGASGDRTPDELAVGTVCFRLSRDRKWNHDWPMYEEVDFLSL